MKTYKVTMDLKQFCWNSSREVSRTQTIQAESKGDAIRKVLTDNQFSVLNESYCEAVEL